MEAYFLDEKKFIDYYSVLGVSVNSTQKDIRKKYREGMKIYHPDVYPNLDKEVANGLKKKAQQLSEAYSILGDENKRKNYNIEYYLHYLIECKKRQDSKKYKKKERGMSFAKRHQIFDERAYKIHEQRTGQSKKEAKGISLQIGRGSLHIFGEVFYQFSKLARIKTDSIPSFVYKNKKSLAGFIIATTCVFGLSQNDKSIEKIFARNDQIEERQSNQEFFEKRINLDYLYTIQGGDTLSDIAIKTGYSVDTLKRKNGLIDERIYMGDQLKIPYIISQCDLEDCTEQVVYDGDLSLQDFALQYHTTEDSIKKLNEESIININGVNTIIDNTLTVPTFESSNHKTKQKAIY